MKPAYGWKNDKETATEYLGRIINVKKTYEFNTDIGRQIINQRLKTSLRWCKQELQDEYEKILISNKIEEDAIHF